jgi:steroid delta-isomerase-like uncharacterized protein
MIALCRQWQDALDRRDPNGLASLYSETTDLESPMAGDAAGRAGVVKASEGFFGAFPEAVFNIEPPIIDGPRAALVAEISGRQAGSFMGLPPTGKSIRFHIVFVLDAHDGLIIRDRRIYDFTGVLVQIGVLKAKPA